MDFQSMYLSRKETRRFLEIANGENVATNNPDEDALFRKGLVKESVMVFTDLDDNMSVIDERAVTLSDVGKEYLEWYMIDRKRKRKEDIRFWIGILVAVSGIIISVVLAMH